MAELSSISPLRTYSPRELLENRRAIREKHPGWQTVVYDALNSESAGMWIDRQFQRFAYRYDPNFNLTRKRLEELTEGLDQKYWPAFATAVSDDHASYLSSALRGVQDSREKLAALGAGGAVARVAAAILDPVFLIGAGVPGYLGKGAIYSTRLSRLQRFTRAGLLTGTTDASLEASIAKMDPDRGFTDVLTVFVGGLALGGLGAALPMKRIAIAAEETKKVLEHADVTELVTASGGAMRFSEKGNRYFKNQQDPSRKRKAIEQYIDDMGFTDEEMVDIRALLDSGDLDEVINRMSRYGTLHSGQAPKTVAHFGESTPQQATQPKTPGEAAPTSPKKPREPKKLTDFTLPDILTSARSWASWLRYSIAGRSGRNPSPLYRQAMSAMVQDAMLKKGGGPSIHAASEWVNLQLSARLSIYLRALDHEFKAFVKRKKIPIGSRNKAKEEYLEEVGKTVRRPRGDQVVDVEVKNLADLQRDMQADLLQLLQRHGAKGFDEVSLLQTYLPRIYRSERIDQLVATYGLDEVNRLFTEAFQLAHPGLDPGIAAKAGASMRKVTQNLQHRYNAMEQGGMANGTRPEIVREILKEADVPDEAIESIVRAMTPDAERRGVITTRGLPRVLLDENHHIQARNLKTGEVETVLFTSMLENNAAQLMDTYIRQALGASAMSEVFQKMSIAANRKIETIQDLKNATGKEMGDLGLTSGKIETELKRLDLSYRVITGRRIGSPEQWAKYLRALRLYNHVRVSGQFGVAQLPEIGIEIGSVGFITMLQQMPAFAKIYKRGRGGELSNRVLDEMETIWGLGTSRQRDVVAARMDMGASIKEYGGGRFERGLRWGASRANDASFMAPIHIFEQRSIGLLVAQQWTRIAYGGRQLSKKRLESLALTQKKADAISSQIRKHSDMEKGVFGRRIIATNVEAWDDVQAASDFIVAIDKHARRAVMEIDIGNLGVWMTNDVGRMIFQYRSFALVAWEKQLLFRLQMTDWTSLIEMTHATWIAALGYIAQQHAVSAGRPDREEYLAKKLSMKNVGRAAFQRASFSTFFPEVGDLGWKLAGGNENVFNARNSTLNTREWFGNPTFGMVDDILGTTANLTRSMRQDDDNFTQSEARKALSLLPLSRAFGPVNMLNLLTRPLPEK